jgi:ATP-binding protein involved in chromosome partitioning
VEEQAARLGVPFLGRVPLDIAVREASDEGRPVALEDGPRGQAFRDIAAQVALAVG